MLIQILEDQYSEKENFYIKQKLIFYPVEANLVSSALSIDKIDFHGGRQYVFWTLGRWQYMWKQKAVIPNT